MRLLSRGNARVEAADGSADSPGSTGQNPRLHQTSAAVDVQHFSRDEAASKQQADSLGDIVRAPDAARRQRGGGRCQCLVLGAAKEAVQQRRIDQTWRHGIHANRRELDCERAHDRFDRSHGAR